MESAEERHGLGVDASCTLRVDLKTLRVDLRCMHAGTKLYNKLRRYNFPQLHCKVHNHVNMICNDFCNVEHRVLKNEHNVLRVDLQAHLSVRS